VTQVEPADQPAVQVAPEVAGRPERPDPQLRRGRVAAIEIVVGTALVGVMAAGGLYFSLRPASGALDAWFPNPLAGTKSAWFTELTRLRYPTVIVVGAIAAAAVTVRRDRPRALACLVGPPLALLVAELVAKPLVGRTLGGNLSYPSGSTVGAAALATAAVLATPARWRGIAAALGAGYALWMTVAVVSLQWHYPTDALAGLALGVGTMLLIDGVTWKGYVGSRRLTAGRTARRDAHRPQGAG
jgi:membrane-associated phospholipid phosphatase